MSDVVTITREGNVAIVTVDNPPVNAVGQAVRQGLWDAVPELDGDDGVEAVILACAGRTFIAGADIREFDGGAMEPWLPDLVERIHAAKKPWIAALFGTVLGGGLETALGCHYRIAHPATKIGLPEVSLGILPGAGGTQRTPRITGAAAAVKLVTTGAPIGAQEAEKIGLVDRLAEDLAAEALAFARDVAGRDVPRLDPAPAQTDLTPADWDELRTEVEKKARGQISPVRAFDAVRAAFELPLDEGMKLERATFLELKETDQSKALRHAFFAERAVAKPAALKGATPRDLDKIAVIGGGLMGSGIATAALNAGYDVAIVEQSADAATAAQDRVAGNLASAVKRGKLSEAVRDATLARLTTAADFGPVSDADLVIEAVFEETEVKRSVFDRLAAAAPRDAILATNTSYIDPTKFTAQVPNPERIMGLHFFSPAHIMRLVEVVKTPATHPDVLATGFAMAKKMRKVAVLSGICDGFIGNRILGAYGRMAGYLLEDGASAQQIDGAMKAFGMPMGPFEMFDMAGLQIGYANRKREAATRPADQRYSRIPDLIVEQGWTGQKTRQGYYRYEEGSRAALPSPETDALIATERAHLGMTPRSFTDEEIVATLHAVQVNEACKILAEKIAERPLDIDVVKMMGYGYPRWRGGPMQEADARGTDRVLATMQGIAAADPGSWQVSPLLSDLGSAARPFAGLNG
ncbi:FAD-dependent oxidoreductase [Pontivivens ytuae]|uniref:Enoyl-CoA hydratase/isomerase family protein n=1 Tax=Pontivivens ytuae TaxID=2789856 RepID=A0A7S9QBK4_9RHOB|nr:FAD-dependent oxidoreductase [Pontivivens ytuae]QPH52417.1 enoyl-CoA hydratase/isomerase family protein [Pontivivens ytuae]